MPCLLYTSIIGSFLYIACSEWWLRFLDDPAPYLHINISFMRPGFRMLVFSVVIMIVVLFFRKGIMGDREFSSIDVRAVVVFLRTDIRLVHILDTRCVFADEL